MDKSAEIFYLDSMPSLSWENSDKNICGYGIT